MAERQSIQELLEHATNQMETVDTRDTTAALHAAWTGVHTTGAACEILKIWGTGEYAERALRADAILARAVAALREAPSLRRTRPPVLNPAGSPDNETTEATLRDIRIEIIRTAHTSNEFLARTRRQARTKTERRVCGRTASAVRDLADCFAITQRQRMAIEGADAVPDYPPARDAAEIRQIIDDRLRQLDAADPTNTPTALAAAWYGLVTVVVLSNFLAVRDPDHAVLHKNALPVIAEMTVTLEAAPSLPANVHGLGLETTTPEETTDDMLTVARQGINRLVLAINTLLPRVADKAEHNADRASARDCTRHSSHLGDCFSGRFYTFL